MQTTDGRGWVDFDFEFVLELGLVLLFLLVLELLWLLELVRDSSSLPLLVALVRLCALETPVFFVRFDLMIFLYFETILTVGRQLTRRIFR
jgi:hypothetical protein